MFKHFIQIICIFALVITACSGGNSNQSPDGNPETDSIAGAPRIKSSVNLTFAGDVMMGTNFPSDYLTPDSGKTLFNDCDSIFRRADLAIVNLEGTCYDGTDGEVRKMTNPKTYFIFRMPGYLAQNLVDAGIDAVNCANNHSFDFGMTGRKNTLQNLRNHKLGIAGIRELAEGCVLERDGVKFAYIGFAASCTKVLDMLDYEQIDSMIQVYRKLGDILVVSFHGGAEGTQFQHVPMKEEHYVGEDRGDVHKFAHFCIDKGADIVIGHGPHVPRAVELYKGHFIAYSLGNFCTPYRMGTSGITGYAPLLEVNLNTSDGTFIDGEIHSFRQFTGKGPRTDSTYAAAKNIRQLTLSDFPETKLTIDDNGKISRK